MSSRGPDSAPGSSPGREDDEDGVNGELIYFGYNLDLAITVLDGGTSINVQPLKKCTF